MLQTTWQTKRLTFTCSLQAYNNATVLIWVHGASMANLVYMPEGSIGIHIVPGTDDPKTWIWPEEYVRDIANTVSRMSTPEQDPGCILRGRACPPSLMPGWQGLPLQQG